MTKNGQKFVRQLSDEEKNKLQVDITCISNEDCPQPMCIPGKDEGCNPVVCSNGKCTQDPTASWKTYRNKEIGFSVKIPQNIDIKEEQKVTLSSKELGCETDVIGELQDVSINEILVDFEKHTGSSYEDVWKEVFGHEFEDGYDNLSIDGKKGYSFVAGAESLYGRKAILLEVSKTEFLGINVYYPILAYNCNPKLKSQNELNNINDQILSTFWFLE